MTEKQKKFEAEHKEEKDETTSCHSDAAIVSKTSTNSEGAADKVPVYVPGPTAVDITPDKDGGVTKEILRPGTGEDGPLTNDLVSVHYVGSLTDGTKFDSSRDRDEFHEFSLGKGSVIKAWDLAVATMKRGELCVIQCSAEYGYGKKGSKPKIPPNVTLVFEMELFNWKGEDISEIQDGGIRRSIVIRGKGFYRPRETAACTVHITGKLGGRVFEDRDVTFVVGEAEEAGITAGIEQAAKKSRQGEKSRLVVNPKYGYGSEGNVKYGIPPNATLDYDIEMLSFELIKKDDKSVAKRSKCSLQASVAEKEAFRKPSTSANEVVSSDSDSDAAPSKRMKLSFERTPSSTSEKLFHQESGPHSSGSKHRRKQAPVVIDQKHGSGSNVCNKDASGVKNSDKTVKAVEGGENVECCPEVINTIDEARAELVRIETQAYRMQEVRRMIQRDERMLPSKFFKDDKWWFIVDTNVFLENLQRFRNLKTQLTTELQTGFMFLLPWVVLQEMDYIKDRYVSTKTVDVRSRAATAVAIINKWMHKKDQTIICQSSKEAACLFEVKDGFRVEKNDDKVIHCCLQIQDRVPNNKVALLTLDQNLRTKAMATSIKAFSMKMLEKWVPDANKVECFSPQLNSTLSMVAPPVQLFAQVSVPPQLLLWNQMPSDESSDVNVGASTSSAPDLCSADDFDDSSWAIETPQVLPSVDGALEKLTYLSDRIRRDLLDACVYSTTRPLVVQSLIKLRGHSSALRDHFKSKDGDSFSTALNDIAQEYNVQVSPVSREEVSLLFADESNREMLMERELKIEELHAAVADAGRLLTPTENWLLSKARSQP